MSVIQDALRRKLDEQRTRAASGEPPEPTPAPPQAPPVAQQVIQNETRAARRPRPTQNWERPIERNPRGPQPRDEPRTVQLLLGLILVMLVGAFIGAVMYFLDARNPAVRTESVALPAPQPQPVAPAVAPAAPVVAPAQPQVNVTPQPVVSPAPTPAPVHAAALVAAVPAPAPAPVPVSAPALAATTATGWPVISVGGVLAGSTAKGSSAILNGEWVRVRQKVDGVRLTAVSNEGVTLEYQGESRFVETGTSTDDEE